MDKDQESATLKIIKINNNYKLLTTLIRWIIGAYAVITVAKSIAGKKTFFSFFVDITSTLSFNWHLVYLVLIASVVFSCIMKCSIYKRKKEN